MAERWAELERKKAKLAQIRAEKEQRRIRERKVEKDGEILTYRGDGEEVVAMRLGGLTIRSLSLREPEDSKTSGKSKLPKTTSRSTQTSVDTHGAHSRSYGCLKFSKPWTRLRLVSSSSL